MKMKKFLSFVLSSALTLSLCSGMITGITTTSAAGSDIIRNDETGIPDTGLYKVVLKEADANKDGVLTQAEAANITELYAYDCGISNIKKHRIFNRFEKTFP